MYKYNYDYSKTMMMKIGLANPDNKGGSVVYNTFEQALDKIKVIDNLTAHAPKIIYLVGWQYLGHDDRYPAFFEVNEHLKRECDNSAKESLIWLINEAKKYNATVSLHINLSDAYPDSPLWNEYIKKDLILLDNKNKPKVTGVWNDRKSYQVRFAQEFKSGCFQKRVDKLFELLPVENMKTIHVDAFFVRKGKNTTIAEEKIYRKKMIEYFNSKGVDVTSEFIYREQKSGYRSLWGKSDIVGIIPAVWNLKMTQKDFLKVPANVLAGGRLTKGLQRDMDLQYLFYGNIHGEDILMKKCDWESEFLHSFATENLPYFYLNSFKREKITGFGKYRIAHFSSNVKTFIKNKKITKNGRIVKENNTLLIPMHWRKNEFYAYSDMDCCKTFNFYGNNIEIYKVTASGEEFIGVKETKNNNLELNFKISKSFIIKKIN